MKALTINQPYAHLIVTPQAELPDGMTQKLVENRVWTTRFRGEIAVHAGQSLKWFTPGSWPAIPHRKLQHADFPQMTFGAIVGVATIIDVFAYDDIERGTIPMRRMWLQSHAHVIGPFCFVLDHVRRLDKPIACTGRQGFWKVDEAIEAKIRNQLSQSTP